MKTGSRVIRRKYLNTSQKPEREHTHHEMIQHLWGAYKGAHPDGSVFIETGCGISRLDLLRPVESMER